MTSAGSCCAIGRSGFAIIVLAITTAVATTGWAVTALSRERIAAPAPIPAPEAAPRPSEIGFVPRVVPMPPANVGVSSEAIEVVVASKDLAVGTMLTRDDLKDTVKVVKRPKDGLSPTVVLNPEELIDKRLSRPLRAEEAICTQDLSKGGVLTLPEGCDMVSLAVNPAQAAAGFVGPGSRVDVLATLRDGNKLIAFPLLVNMLVVAVDTNVAYAKDSNGTFPTMNTVSFAVKGKEALLLSLAKARGCTLELLLRHPNKSPEMDKRYNIEEVIKLLSDEERGTTKPAAPAPRPAGDR